MDFNTILPEFSISASALKAERVRMQNIAENIANMHTTREDGNASPYRRKDVIFSEVLDRQQYGGVKVSDIENDPAPPLMIYRPNHPDANSDGYVQKPNIDLHFEMVDLISSSRAYQANLTAMKLTKDMAQRTINMGQ